jgi:hypothetical protein
MGAEEWLEGLSGRNSAEELSPRYSGSTLVKPRIWDWQHPLEIWFGVDVFLTLALSDGVLSASNVEVRRHGGPPCLLL